MTDFKPNFLNKNVDRSAPAISISAVLGMIQEPFDQMGVAQKTYDKHFNNPESQYYQKSIEEICEMWSAKGAESCKYGSLLDDYIGMNLLNQELELKLWKLDNNYEYDERLLAHCNSFDDFYKLVMASGDTEFIDREKYVYLKIDDFYIRGRFDALFRNKRTGKWIVIDWKSSGSIDKVPNKWTKKLLGPACKFPALNYYTYTMQLYFYKKALIEGGYLPEGTSYDDVTVMIVNLPDHIIKESGKRFATHNAAFEFDNEFMNRLLNFAVQKQRLLDMQQKPVEQEEEQNISEEAGDESNLPF
jgi:hypothetical protein